MFEDDRYATYSALYAECWQMGKEKEGFTVGELLEVMERVLQTGEAANEVVRLIGIGKITVKQGLLYLTGGAGI